MIGLARRVVERWLRAVAPDDWAENVLGDVIEDHHVRGDTRPRWRDVADTAGVAARFTVDLVRTRWQDRRSGGRTMTLGQDLKQTWRSLRRSAGFTVTTIAILALGIGANTAIYTALSQLVLRPLPFRDGGRLVFLWQTDPSLGQAVLMTPSSDAIARLRTATHVFDGIETHAGRDVVLTESGEPQEVLVSLVRPSLLALLGVQPIAGRSIGDADLDPNAPPVILISHAIWQSRFGGDPGAIGRTMRLSDRTFTIVGVMPPRFALPDGSNALWAAAQPGLFPSEADGENTIARLAPGLTVAQAQKALDAIGGADGDSELKKWTGRITTPAEMNGVTVNTALYVLAGAVGLVLLIACVNVTNLILSRDTSRQRETAVRHALGASRLRLLRSHLIESGVLAAAGGIAGVALAHGGLAAMNALRPRQLHLLERLHLDATALTFAALVTLITTLLVGLAPALRAARADLQTLLAAGGRGATAPAERLRRVLTIAQVALALTLLIGSTLLARSYGRLTARDPGYRPDGVLSVRVSLPISRYPASEAERRQQFFDQVRAAMTTMPDIAAVAIGNGVPPDNGITFGDLAIEGRPPLGTTAPRLFSGGYVTPNYFSTLGIPIRQGRAFSDEDTFGRTGVVIVGESLARSYWPQGDAVGSRIRLQTNGEWLTIVGVAGDVLTSFTRQIYYARAQARPGSGALVIRTTGNPYAVLPAIKAAIWAQDPALPLADVATAHELLARSTSLPRFNLALLGVLALSGFVLAVVGVYGVTSLQVSQRQREVGIRVALGASRVAVTGLVLRQTGMLLAAGTTIGVVAAVWLSRYIETLLYQTARTDVMSFAAAAAAIVTAGLVAAVVPIRRALSVDPTSALRSE
ncbi:MAG TPA: ABC transporter permease [Vicinamibacterales bacterium]|nr:ABC transporter permease [Vicinamibacterales bacterium]